MFRDSRGVVHTVASPDPLVDLPPEAATALQRVLLQGGDLGTRLEQCEAVRELLDRWVTAFFEELPDEVDLEEEARAAAEAGISLERVEQDCTGDEPLHLDPRQHDLAAHGEDEADDEVDPREQLPEELVAVLERALLLLPVRVRLEALLAASDLAAEWEELLADHEKLLGHLLLTHADAPEERGHDQLAQRHAVLHEGTGPGH